MSVPPGRRCVLVIGASSGIGRATAEQLLAAGHRVVLAARDAGTLEAVAAGRADALPVVCDVTDAGAVRQAVDSAVARFGRLDAVVHTAQVMAYGRIEDVEPAVYDRVVDVAMKGTANIARTVLPLFRRQGHGTLVIVNSLLGEIATPRMGAYDAAKWGQLGLARVLQLEVRDAPGVDVCIVSPGAIDTPIYDQAANYAGRGGFPPPPVVPAARVATAAVRCLDRPRRHVEVGPVNTLTVLGFRLVPAVFDRIVGPLVGLAVFRGERAGPDPGNVLDAQPQREAISGGWTVLGTRRAHRGVRPLSASARARLADRSLNYADVGVTRSPAAEATVRTVRLGHGRTDFDAAADRVMHWQVQRQAGLSVAASSPVVTQGADVLLRFGVGPVGIPAPCRVVWTVDEPDRRGFAYGTLDGHPEAGEEAFVVAVDAGGAVTLTVTVSAVPAGLAARLGGPITHLAQRLILHRYLTALGGQP